MDFLYANLDSFLESYIKKIINQECDSGGSISNAIDNKILGGDTGRISPDMLPKGVLYMDRGQDLYIYKPGQDLDGDGVPDTDGQYIQTGTQKIADTEEALKYIFEE